MTYRSYRDTTTRSSVLKAIASSGDEAAWTRFFNLYAGFVFAIARSKGLSAEDADDVVQNVFVDLLRQLPTFEYDRTKGKFRSYLFGLVNWRVIDRLKLNKRESELELECRKAGAGGITAGHTAEVIEREWQSAALKEALNRLQKETRPDHFAVFVESAIEGIDTETVMRLHGISRDNLYQIRKRFTVRLTPLVTEVLKEMDEGRLSSGSAESDPNGVARNGGARGDV